MIDNLFRKVLIFGIIIVLVGTNYIPSLTCSTTSSVNLTERLGTGSSIDNSVTKTVASANNGLPDLIFAELRAWWGSLNTTGITGIFVDYDVNNKGDTYYGNEPIVSNLSFFADDNMTSFGYILQSPMFYPSIWYPGEILGGCNFFEMDEKPDTITVKIDFTNLIPESDETNNNLTVAVLLGVTISGSAYKNENGEMIPFEGIIELNQYDDDSLSDFGYRHYWSDENGNYSMSLCPMEPLDEPHIYDIMACDIADGLKILKKTNLVKAGENATLDFLFGAPPDTPDRPFGRKLGLANRTYLFFSSTSDKNYDQIYYKFSWGDGIYSNWIGPYASNEIISAGHAWNESGAYTIRVVSKNSIGMLSEWSNSLKISIPENRQISSRSLLQFLEKISDIVSNFFAVKIPSNVSFYK